MVSCPNCIGTGYIKSPTALSVDVFRSIRHEIIKKNIKVIKVFGSVGCISYMINFKRSNIASLEKENKINIFLYVESSLSDGDYKVESFKSLSPEDEEKLGLDKPLNLKKSSTEKKHNNTKNNSLVKKLYSKFV